MKKRFKDYIRMLDPHDVTTDPHRGVLIADFDHHQVLLLRKSGDVVMILDKQAMWPWSL